MKNRIFLLACIGLLAIFIASCKKFLDKAPESTFTEEEVFSNYDNFRLFFDNIYKGAKGSNPTITNYRNNQNIFVVFPLYFSGLPEKFSLEQMTDFSDGGWWRQGETIKGGSMGALISLFYNSATSRPIFITMWRIIRICNTALEKVDGLKDVDQTNIDDIIAQAHFCRAFAHFALFDFWGPMPYITKVVGPYDQWDIPRLSKHETLMNIAADLDTAYTYFEKANMMRRDNPEVSGAGHLNSPDQFRPTGVLSKALKGRVLLYAASALNNELGAKDYEEAAKANWEAIEVAKTNGYFLLSAADYKLNFVGTNYSDEQLWAWPVGAVNYSNLIMGSIINSVFQKSGSCSCDCPTQNAVDKFETKWGDPLNTQADRDAATALNHYNEQNPYKDRDPRFYIDVIYNQAPIPGYTTAQIYTETVAGKPKYSELLDQTYKDAGITHTGYYSRKLWGGQSVKNNISPYHTDPYIRLAELYLNYAEAANEAYGPNTAAPGATLTAVQAINIVRQRIGQADVQSQFTDTKEHFRPRIKNERNVELAFEGHYFFDIRRWMDAPVAMGSTVMGISIEKVPVSATYPIGFKHTRIELSADRQSKWTDAMYYFPFLEADYNKMKKFDTSLNPRW